MVDYVCSKFGASAPIREFLAIFFSATCLLEVEISDFRKGGPIVAIVQATIIGADF